MKFQVAAAGFQALVQGLTGRDAVVEWPIDHDESQVVATNDDSTDGGNNSTDDQSNEVNGSQLDDHQEDEVINNNFSACFGPSDHHLMSFDYFGNHFNVDDAELYADKESKICNPKDEFESFVEPICLVYGHGGINFNAYTILSGGLGLVPGPDTSSSPSPLPPQLLFPLRLLTSSSLHLHQTTSTQPPSINASSSLIGSRLVASSAGPAAGPAAPPTRLNQRLPSGKFM
uniref:Uncharacterized protein n=1 Tax=Chenopodium quinoa TaxID=63459 RepID=A0A803LT05_CHEQI